MAITVGLGLSAVGALLLGLFTVGKSSGSSSVSLFSSVSNSGGKGGAFAPSFSSETLSDLGARSVNSDNKDYIINGVSPSLSSPAVSSHAGVYPLGSRAYNAVKLNAKKVAFDFDSSSSESKNDTDNNNKDSKKSNKKSWLSTLLLSLLKLTSKALFWIIIAIVGVVVWLLKNDDK